MLPKISVVTPSFNQGKYLESTIRSVIGQNYPNLEYILIDGGSTDHSVQIIKKYVSHFSYWQSQKDRNQTDAINQGLNRATGDILCWLNSDDMHFPDTLDKVANEFLTKENGLKEQLLIGNYISIHPHVNKVYTGDAIKKHETLDIRLMDYIRQPSSFWSKSVWDKVGDLNEALDFGMDWDWYIRVAEAGIPFHPVADYLSIDMRYDTTKTALGGEKRIRELANILSKYSGQHVGDAYNQWHDNDQYAKEKSKMGKLRLHKVTDLNKIIFKKYFSGKLSYEQFLQIIRA